MNAIVIMAKAPIPNDVKTRLVPPLDPMTASDLYRSFLLDKIEQVAEIDAQCFLAFAPDTAESIFREIVPRKFILLQQEGNNLGERLANVTERLFAQGFKKVILVDSDTPNLPSKMLSAAISRLDSVEVVVGPCEDGGYYLIGMKSYLPNIFKDIPWSTRGVVTSTVRRIVEMEATFSLLDKWYDIDRVEDLLRLKRDLNATFQARQACRNTFDLLSKLNLKE